MQTIVNDMNVPLVVVQVDFGAKNYNFDDAKTRKYFQLENYCFMAGIFFHTARKFIGYFDVTLHLQLKYNDRRR